MDIPTRFHDLMDSTALALIGTIGPRGEPQITPSWFLWEDGHTRFSLVEGRQRLRNLRRDPRVSIVIVDPSRPTRYVELRGRIGALEPDPDLSLEKVIARKYAGSWRDVEAPGTPRWAAAVRVEKVNSQAGFE